jgi:penicillin-insensitive murein endopeptidase
VRRYHDISLKRARWFLVAVVLVVGFAEGSRADAPAMTVAEVERLLGSPARRKGPTSLGHTNGGALVKAAAIPREGRGWVVPASFVERGTQFGTRTLIDTVTTAIGEVTEAFPGSRLVVGNLGLASGKRIQWSVSHQAGRDADLGIYARTTGGKRVEALPFTAFGRDGTARSGGRTVVFDDARNLALVRALVERRGSRVQYIFLARWLKARLLAEATRQKVPRGVIARLDAVLHQPGDSSPHDDHYHVRVFCDVDDRLYGCQDRGPERDWVERGEARVRAFIRGLGAVIAQPGRDRKLARLARLAVERLADLHHADAADHLLTALLRPEAAIRKAALGALRATGVEAVAEALLDVLPEVRDVAWLGELLEVARSAATQATVARAVVLAGRPEAALHPEVVASKGTASKALATVRGFAAEVLARLGDGDEAAHREALSGLLDDPDPGVAKTAHAALRRLTCTFHAKPEDWSKDAARAPRGVGRFAMVDPRFPEEAKSREGVKRLIALLVHRDDAVRSCAGRALASVTGHKPELRGRPPAQQRRVWQRWWDEHGARLRLPP